MTGAPPDPPPADEAAAEREEKAAEGAASRAGELAGLVSGGDGAPAPGPVRRLAAASARWTRETYGRSRDNLRAFLAAKNPALWLIALLVGAAVGIAAVGFRLGIGLVQWLWLGETGERIIADIRAAPWWVVVLAPVAGGLVVGLLNQFVLAGRRTGAVADVIEASARGGRGLGLFNGLVSAFATVVSLGSGASAGREGPVIHLGATLAAFVTARARLSPQDGRAILAAGVASAISASFNAPIAGVLFAHEVILRHMGVSAFVPVVIASTAGTLAGRYFIGDVAAFEIPAYTIGSPWEMPAFALLGVVAAVVSVTFQFAVGIADQTARAVTMPAWARPMAGGVVIGAMGVFLPQIMGVGYEATDIALHGGFPLGMLILLVVAKVVATAVTLASRFGGGIFSPALYLGAMTGAAFGIVASSAFPGIASAHGLYAILGMGAVAGALLGAPISTTVIVFELTGGYALSIALLLSVSIATGLHLAVHGRSFFHWQLETRGVVLADGPHRYVLKTVPVSAFMSETESPAALTDPDDPRKVRANDTLETALRIFNETGADALAVTDPRERTRVVGTVSHVQALRAYNRRLVERSVEEHR